MRVVLDQQEGSELALKGESWLAVQGVVAYIYWSNVSNVSRSLFLCKASLEKNTFEWFFSIVEVHTAFLWNCCDWESRRCFFTAEYYLVGRKIAGLMDNASSIIWMHLVFYVFQISGAEINILWHNICYIYLSIYMHVTSCDGNYCFCCIIRIKWLFWRFVNEYLTNFQWMFFLAFWLGIVWGMLRESNFTWSLGHHILLATYFYGKQKQKGDCEVWDAASFDLQPNLDINLNLCLFFKL